MREVPRRGAFLLLALTLAVPTFAAAFGPEVTLPAVGRIYLPNDNSYRTEIVLTNHRDVPQYVMLSTIQDGHDSPRHIFQLEAHRTAYLQDGSIGLPSNDMTNFLGAMRIRAIVGTLENDEPNVTPDPLGQLEATAFIVSDRGRFGSKGSTRQEIEGVQSAEYHAEEAVFLGVRHSYGTGFYTNVGIANLHPTQTETFFIEFQFGALEPVVVPPLSVRQVRVGGNGSGGRYVRVIPQWALTDEAPARTTPWVAYASTIDMQTGDAFSGIRVPSTAKYNRID